MQNSLMMVSLLIGLVAGIQLQSPPDSPSSQMSAYASHREALLAVGSQAMKKKDYAEALADYRKVVALYPKDGRVLLIAGNAAWAAGSLEEAADYYRRCLEHPGDHPWPARVALLEINVALGRWDDVADEKKALEQAAASGDPQLQKALSEGFVLEQFAVGRQFVEVIDYPAPDQVNGVRYRFQLGGKPISEDVFVSHIDLMKSSGNPRQFVLKQHLEAESPKLIKSYPEGEPAYQDIRADVLRLLEAQTGTTKLTPLSPFGVVPSAPVKGQ
jgi:tetratricopeptide (TPR) repeat protein